MTFKEKHLLPLMLTATMAMSCGEAKVPFLNNDNDNNKGLLDERPQKDVDKYNTKVVLYQVDVPVYNEYGVRMEGQSVLTRGLNKSSYKSPQRVESMPVKQVYLNGSNKFSYVKADVNNAIYTKKGFSGLFIDYNDRAVIVSDENISKFISSLESRSIAQRERNNEQKRTVEVNSEPIDDAVKHTAVKDTIASDSIEHNDTIKPDTVSVNSTFTDTQFLDTLRTMRQKEI